MSYTAKIHQPFIKMKDFITTLKQLAPFIIGILVVFIIMNCLTGCTKADEIDNTAGNAINHAFDMCKSGTAKVTVEAASGVETTTFKCEVNE